jgi:hypothetical protein
MTDHINGYVDPAAWAELKRETANQDQKQRDISWTQKDLDETLAHIYEQQKLMLRGVIRPLVDHIKKLEARIEEIEKCGISYKGVYQRSCEYRRGSMTTYAGDLWACIADAAPNECPGSSTKWQLCVKSGNGKDHDAQRRLPTQGGARPSSIVEKRT